MSTLAAVGMGDNTLNDELLKLATPEELADYEAKLAQAETDKADAAALLARINGLLSEAKQRFPANTFNDTAAQKRHKASANGVCERLSNIELRRTDAVKNTFVSLLSNRQRQQELDAKKAREARWQAEAQDKVQRAVQFLLARGKVLGTDFNLDNALSTANDIVFDEKIAEAKQGGLISFNGQNCDGWGDDDKEPCGGWDGESRRCECGNRRVSWEYDGDFESMTVYGEAY